MSSLLSNGHAHAIESAAIRLQDMARSSHLCAMDYLGKSDEASLFSLFAEDSRERAQIARSLLFLLIEARSTHWRQCTAYFIDHASGGNREAA